ncbi:peptidase inhibitor family I36 protein [Streptomyces olindensis]|uniref:peptidase inhibitor family I36 protein n=1 Tax=Streptomyces olindensis TaxID=358823 RepID=UPI003674D3BB
MRKIRAVLAAASLAAIIGAAGVPAASAAPAAEGYDRCDEGKFCFFSGWNGKGSICEALPPLQDTVEKCGPWAGNSNAKSAYNRSSRAAVNIYAGTNYTQRKGSVEYRGNLQGSYKIRSFN